MNKINHAMRYAGKLVLTLFLLICLFIPTPAFALDYNSEAKNYLTSVQNELGSIKTIIQQLPNISLKNGQKTLAEVQAKLENIESESKQKAVIFKNFSNNYQVSYQDKLASITTLYNLQKEYQQKILDLPNSLGNFYIGMLSEVNQSIQQYEQESRDLSKVIVLTDKVSVLANNLEKRINLAKQKTNNIKEYAEVLQSFSDPDILGEINDLDQYIGELTQNLPL